MGSTRPPQIQKGARNQTSEPNRSTKLDAEITARFCDAVRLGCSYKLASKAAGISESTFGNWQRRSKTGEEPFVSFMAEVERAESDHAQACLESIMAARDTDWKAGAWMMERRHGYVRREEVSGPDGGPVQIETADPKVILEEMIGRMAKREQQREGSGVDLARDDDPKDR